MQYIVVFDTNILISALLSPTSNPFRCLALAQMGQIESVTCPEILNEFLEKLTTKFKFSPENAQAAIDEICRFSRLVQISAKLRVVPDDPDDDMVIECASLAGATHIITGDKHLLSLQRYQSIEIIKTAAFIEQITLD